jgi:glycosyltransferase involved in cell wall biosynthesis
VKSGPGRFVQYLRESEFADCELTFFSDQIDQSEGNKVAVPGHPVMRHFPLYWITRNVMFYRSFLPVQDQFDAILCTSALEAMSLIKLHKKIAILIMVNDDNLVNAREGFWSKVKMQGFGKSSSRYWHRRLEYEVCSKARLVITNSDFTSREVTRGYKLSPERVVKLYKAVDLSVFSSGYLSPKSEFPQVPRLLFLKNDFRRGGLDILIDALAQWPAENAFDLTVAGISPQEVATVEKALERAKLPIRNSSVKSLLNREEISNMYREHDLFINMARQEALGVSCLEAMASGLPVIASKSGGLPEVLAGGKAGFMLPLHPDALRECLQRIMSDSSVLNEKRVAMKKQVAKFSKVKMVSNFNGIMMDVLSE